MNDNPFLDKRVEELLVTVGITSTSYQWLFETQGGRSVDRNQGSVDVYSEEQSAKEMIELLKKANKGFPVNAEKTKLDWRPGEFIRFYVSFNKDGEWRIK